jgi:hypothetical protein
VDSPGAPVHNPVGLRTGPWGARVAHRYHHLLQTPKTPLANHPENVDPSTPFETPFTPSQTGSIKPIIGGSNTPVSDIRRFGPAQH